MDHVVQHLKLCNLVDTFDTFDTLKMQAILDEKGKINENSNLKLERDGKERRRMPIS